MNVDEANSSPLGKPQNYKIAVHTGLRRVLAKWICLLYSRERRLQWNHLPPSPSLSYPWNLDHINSYTRVPCCRRITPTIHVCMCGCVRPSVCSSSKLALWRPSIHKTLSLSIRLAIPQRVQRVFTLCWIEWESYVSLLASTLHMARKNTLVWPLTIFQVRR